MKLLTKFKTGVKYAATYVAHRTRQLAFAGLFAIASPMMAEGTVGYENGTSALGTVSTEIAKYVPAVTNVCYALAGVVAILGAISVYIAIHNWLFRPLNLA